MKTNLINIQEDYIEIPSTFEINGRRTDGYDTMTDRHHQDGWRDIIMPEITGIQKLGERYYDKDTEVVTYHVLHKTSHEIEADEKQRIPAQISRMNFIIQVFMVTGLKYEDIISFIQNLPAQYLDEASKYIVTTKLRGCVFFERYSEDLLLIAQMMNISSAQLDEIFINGNAL